MIYFTAHTFKCVCHCRRAMFRVLGMYNFGYSANKLYQEVKNFKSFFFFEELRWTNTNKSYLCNRIKLKVESEKGSIKVHIFWEGHKILRNLHCRFVLCRASQIYGGLLRIYELYSKYVMQMGLFLYTGIMREPDF